MRRNRLLLLGATAFAALSCSHDHPALEGVQNPTTPIVATQLRFTAAPSATNVGASISPVLAVAALDVSGDVVTSFTGSIVVAVGANPGAATLGGTTSVNAVAGVATFSNLSLNKAGAGYTLVATSTTLQSGTSAFFNVAPGAAVVMTKSGGDVQSGLVSTALAANPAVTIKDAFGDGLAGMIVNWAIVGGGGSLSTATSATNQLGVATVAWTLGSASGSQSVSATVAGLTGSPANFTATAAPFVFSSVSGGLDFTCAVTPANAAYCWGHNPEGELGDSTTQSPHTVVPVLGGIALASVSAGVFHACGLTAQHAAYCWGGDVLGTPFGSLGDGTTQGRLVPAAVAGGLSFASLSTGGYDTCGVTSAGIAYCWGQNGSGTVGDGSTTDRLVPTPVAGGLTFAQVLTQTVQTCGLTTGGAAYCWGSTYGLSPSLVPGGVTFASLAAGASQTCGLTSAGAAYCWGDNDAGQLGDGTTATRTAPVAVAGGLVFTSLTGGTHTCGLTAGGAAYCWGSNVYGELGDGTTTDRHVPTAVSGGIVFASVSAGDEHTCGLTAPGVPYCWGRNDLSQVGDGTTTVRLVPTLVIP